MEIPLKIPRKKSSARLWKGQTTEGEIGLAYEKIDSILMQIDKLQRGRKISSIRQQSFPNVVSKISRREKLGYSLTEAKRVLEIIERNGHKLDPPPTCRISEV
jgi:NAD+ synthase